jgi:N-formylglutamate deformylase
MSVFTLHRGTQPLLVSLPHDGTRLGDGMAADLTASARAVPDTDWHVARLYAFAAGMGASLLVPAYSRYVVDLNRPEDDAPLYPGQSGTGLCPLRQFSGDPVYLPGREPDPTQVRERVERYWRPYHQALRQELDRLRGEHGHVVLWEAHSIRGTLPYLFEGRLPDLNLGTADGNSCRPALRQALAEVLAGPAAEGYDHVVDGRFKGGYITRHYGDPAAGIDAVQLELSQRTYMDEASTAYDEARAAALQPLLSALLSAALQTR